MRNQLTVRHASLQRSHDGMALRHPTTGILFRKNLLRTIAAGTQKLNWHYPLIIQASVVPSYIMPSGAACLATVQTRKF
jgi:hypothetical protein